MKWRISTLAVQRSSQTIAATVLALAICGNALGEPPEARPQTDLAQRLERIVEQLQKQAETAHVPGFAVAIVKDDEVILSRGFGRRDIENNLPVTDETLFAIGSTTKAMTATLIGMLIDEGLMSWDDHPRKHLPWFKLSDAAADEQVTLRDMLSHRVGLASNDLLWYAGTATRAEILETITQAELLHPFREKFNYNNVMYLAAGEAAGRASILHDGSWDTLVYKRLFAPLGMSHSDTSVKVAKTRPQLAKGYHWDEDKSEFVHKPMRDLDNIAPAGSVNSCAKDMAQWVRFLLAKGAIGEQRLISAERIEDTWTKQIDIAGEVGYGMGWMLRDLNDRRLVEHSGGIDGFGAYVALLPDDGVGYALLTNVISSALQPMSVHIIFDGLLGEMKDEESPLDLAQVQPYLGKYHFDVLKSDVTVLIQNGKLAVDVPAQMVFELKPPDESGKWEFAITDQIAVSFVNDADGDTIGMKIYQGGLEFELPREGYTPPVDITLAEARKYLGTYHSDVMNADLKVLHRKGRLAIDVPGQMIYDLHLPDADGRWLFRVKQSIAVSFNTNEADEVTALTLHQDGMDLSAPRTPGEADSNLPVLEEVLSLHRKGHGAEHVGAIKTLRMSGSLRFAHQGVHGRIEITAAGLDRYSQTLDLGRFGSIRTALDGEQAWSDSSFGEFEELKDEYLLQTRLQHPLVIGTDWEKFFDNIEVERLDVIDGKKVYVLALTLGKDVTCQSFIDAETGLVVKDELLVRHPGAGALKTTITYVEYREVEGVKLPARFSIANEVTGKMAAEIEKFETNIELPADAFTLKPRVQ